MNDDQRAGTSPLPPGTQRSPRTAAGRDLQAVLLRTLVEDNWEWVTQGILAIEAEAAADSLRSVGPAAEEPPLPKHIRDELENPPGTTIFRPGELRAAQSPNPQGEPPRGVTPALAHPSDSIDVERLEQVSESLKVELRYVGPGDDADAEEWSAFAAEYARLGSTDGH